MKKINPKQLPSVIDKNDWWSEDAPGVYQFCLPWMHGFVEQSKYFHPDYQSIGIYFFKNDFVIEKTPKEEKYQIYIHIYNQFRKNHNYFLKIQNKWEDIRQEILVIGDYFIQSRNNLSNKQLWKLFNKFHKLSKEHMKFGTGLEGADIFSEYYLLDLIKNEIKISDKKLYDILRLLPVMTNLSFIEKERIDFLKLCLRVYDKQSDQIYNLNEVNKFYNNYNWSRTNYKTGREWSKKCIVKDITAEINSRTKKDIKNEISRIQSKSRKIYLQKQKIYKTYNFSKDLKIHFEVLENLSNLIDYRKEIAMRNNYYFELFLAEIARRFSLNIYEIKNYLIDEIEDLLIDNKKVISKLIEKRREFSCYVVIKLPRNKSIGKIFYGRQAEAIWQRFYKIKSTKIKGFPASNPVKNIKGKVKVVLDIDKTNFNKGDILVTTMTRPEFVPLMRKAKAVVTDEGGLTCHAAVISRELKIPCIIGTKNATKILRTGDSIKMDLTSGVVKKIIDDKNINNKTLYLWDLAGTIFIEKWNKKMTGFDNVETWIEHKLNKKRNKMTDLEFEQAHKIPYINGKMFNLQLQPGFKKVLSWTKFNETFSTGNKEQIKWRAKYLNSKVGFDILAYFQKLNSTFDFGSSNKKTISMIVKYLNKKYQNGFKTVVYTDDKISNLKFFKQAAKKLKQKYSDFDYRLYHISNKVKNIHKKDYYFEVNKLEDILKNEKKIYKN